jgi:hypothetical protein
MDEPTTIEAPAPYAWVVAMLKSHDEAEYDLWRDDDATT